MGWDDYDYYEPSRPKKAQGGIKSQNKKGAFGQTWWGKRWIEVVESLGLGSRLNRGKAYARSGQVLSIEVEKGKVTSSVQGSRITPYKQSIKYNSVNQTSWTKLAKILAEQAVFSAKLLSGEMPGNIEQACSQAGLSLFPCQYSELVTTCTCPDSSDPCKHLAAVYYLLAEEFDRDPFLLFKLRGIDREDLLALISREIGSENSGLEKRERNLRNELESTNLSSECTEESLPVDSLLFWQGGELPPFTSSDLSDIPASLPRQLGNFPFWRGKLSLLAVLEEVYNSASTAGLELAAGGFGREEPE